MMLTTAVRATASFSLFTFNFSLSISMMAATPMPHQMAKA